ANLGRGQQHACSRGGLRRRPEPGRPTGTDRVHRGAALRARRLPAQRLRRAGGRARGARVRADGGGQDRGRRVRRAPRARARAEVLLHDADQGVEQPEVRRPRRPARRRRGRAAHRGHRRQRRRAGGGDDHRGAAQHDLRGVAAPGAPRLRGHGRGALPRRPLPRCGVGGGDPPAARARRPGQPVGHGEQRRGVRRLAGHRARRHHRRRRRAPARAAVAAHDGRQPAAGPLRRRGLRRRAADRRRPRAPHPRPGAAERGVGPRPRARPARRARPVPVPAALAHHGARPARPRRAAAGDHVRVQPGRLRRRGRAVRAIRAAPDPRGRGGGDPPHRRGAHRGAAAGRPRGAGLLGVARGAGAGHRRAPRGHAARVQGDRRGAVRPRPGPRGVRHRDPGPGHQHARPHGRAGAVGQVQRREPRRPHPGGVHAAHRPGRAPRHRRRGPRRRRLAARGGPRAGRGPGLHAHLPAAQLVPARLQHGGQPRRAPGDRGGARPAGAVAGPVPGRPLRRRALPADRAQHLRARRLRRVDALPPGGLRRVRRPAPPGRGPGEGALARGGRGAARRRVLVAAVAAPRRRHRGAGRAPRRP
ncbi:MAG: FIG005666: putative helicase, partial [uncultured Pseudonocardia sp.]